MSLFYLLPLRGLLSSLLLYSLILTGTRVVGQENSADQSPGLNSSPGYWKLYTDYATRLTRVSFYTSQHELLYQEKIKDRYIKLSKRTIRQFDDLLVRLVNRNLLGDQVKSYDLLASNQWTPIPQRDQSGFIPEDTSPATVGLNRPMINLKVVSPSQLLLSYLNPTGERLLITIANDSFHYFYKKQTVEKEYAGLINISHLASGVYRFGVDGPQKKALYQLSINQETKSLQLSTLLSQF